MVLTADPIFDENGELLECADCKCEAKVWWKKNVFLGCKDLESKGTETPCLDFHCTSVS